MIFFGHLGIATGIVKSYEKIFMKNNELGRKNAIDYRFVLIGSILPDIIDKPIGAYFFRSVFHNSRIFAHTLLFSIILVVIGLYLYIKSRKSNILSLGICSGIHLILDGMWTYPIILFWPFLGFNFPRRPEGNWLDSDMIRLFTDPRCYLPELIGLIIVIFYFVKLIRNKRMKYFFRNGEL